MRDKFTYMNFIRKYFFISLIGLLFISCEKQFEKKIANPVDVTINRDGMMVLGKKLENPYSVENMQKAYQNLKKKKGDIPDIVIEATHLYIRFLPNNHEEYDRLLWDSIIEIYDHPLDFEILQVGNFYHDPSLPVSSITWQYSAIPIGHSLPTNIRYELLAELFIPPTHYDFNTNKKSDNLNELYELLEEEAFRITNNILESLNNKGSKWTPKGSIKAFDDVLNRYVPIQGVKVRANRWFTTYSANTDINGNFTMSGTFKNPADYSVVWEQEDFDVRDGNWGQAVLKSNNITGDWNANISSGESLLHATIYRAAYRYYYNNTLGIKSPPTNKWYRSKIKIAAHDKDKDFNGDFAKWRSWFAWPQIRIYNLDQYGNLKNKQSVFATTIHELAHASHWDLAVQKTNRNDFIYADDILAESWARGVQWAFTRLEYPYYLLAYGRLNYTGIVQDMIDEYGMKETSSWWNFDTEKWGEPAIYKSYIDKVTGYTLFEIENSLIGIKTWNNWKDNIKNKYSNETESNLDAAFNYWNTK